MTPNIHYKDREIEGERLEFPKDAIYWIGPNVTLRHCTLVFNVSARWLHLLSGNLIDCTIHAKGQLKTLPWASMKLKGCRFKGRFAGNDFGFREDVGESRPRPSERSPAYRARAHREDARARACARSLRDGSNIRA